MSKLTIHIENHEQKYTVSEMRRRLAQVLSKLNGDQIVSFTFDATLANYQSFDSRPSGPKSGIWVPAPTTHQIVAEEQKHDPSCLLGMGGTCSAYCEPQIRPVGI